MIARLAKGLTEHPAEISDTNYADDVRVQSLDLVMGSLEVGSWLDLISGLFISRSLKLRFSQMSSLEGYEISSRQNLCDWSFCNGNVS